MGSLQVFLVHLPFLMFKVTFTYWIRVCAHMNPSICVGTHGACVEVRGQFVEINSHLLLWWLNSDSQAWWQSSFTCEPSHPSSSSLPTFPGTWPLHSLQFNSFPLTWREDLTQFPSSNLYPPYSCTSKSPICRITLLFSCLESSCSSQLSWWKVHVLTWKGGVMGTDGNLSPVPSWFFLYPQSGD